MQKDIRREEKKFVIESEMKCSYVIDIYKSDVRFYFVVPAQYKNMLKSKISDTWPKATVKEEQEIKSFNKDSWIYGLEYKYDDSLSLSVDKKSNALLSSILNTVSIMEDDDRLTLMYNMEPCSQYGWNNRALEAHKSYNADIPIPHKSGVNRFTRLVSTSLIALIDLVLDVFREFCGESTKDIKLISELKNKLSVQTLQKANDTVINTQIAVISYSQDKFRIKNNAMVACNSFFTLRGDNELEPVRVKSINKAPVNKTGVLEGGGLIQLPGKELLKEHNINHINVLETKVPEELQKGYIRIGKSTCKGNTVQTYFSPDKEIANLPVILLGPMGAGKTFQNLQYAKDVIAADEGLICIDYIKKCELASSIEKITPKDKMIVIDLSNENDLQSFSFNEYTNTSLAPFERVENANLKQQQYTQLIDAIYKGEPLSGQMRKYFTSAADVVLLQENTGLKNIIECLENHEKRQEYIKAIPSECRQLLESRISQLMQLDDEKTGTKYSKIEHIMDRVNSLREDIRMEMMFTKSPEKNINFVEAMNNGKVILVKMPGDKFRSEHVRNVLTTFFISKIWLACNIRGVQQDRPLRYHLLLDEIFQAPTAYKTLTNILRECRKFQLRLVFTAHQLADLEEMNQGLKSSGASYILLQGTDKQNFKQLEEEFKRCGFVLDDLLNLKKWHSLNLIKCNSGYCAYVADQYEKQKAPSN